MLKTLNLNLRGSSSNLGLYLIASFFGLIFGYPLVWMVMSSFKSTREMVQSVWALPNSYDLANYNDMLNNATFIRYYQNSLIVVLISVPILTLFASMAAYVFARIKFPGRELLFYAFLAGTMIPIHVTLIPLYTMMQDLNWINKLNALIVPFIGFNLPVSIFIMRDFFSKIPLELEEAARIDGCSTPRIFWSVAMPLARPALVTVVILSVVASWNDYLFALAFVGGNNEAYTLPLGVQTMIAGLGTVHFDRMFTVLTLAALPVLFFYFLAQRQIIKGITSGAIKG